MKPLNRNHLKIVACVSMALDHMGFLLFPHAAALRWAGRLAMPLFAFFIGEGCRYTRNRRKYFLSVFLLGLLCQTAYIVDTLVETGYLGKGSDAWYLDILLAFSVSIPLCYAVADLKTALAVKDPVKTRKAALIAAAGFSAFAAGTALVLYLQRRGWSLHFDYGVWAILLPVSAVLFNRPLPRLLSFAVCTLLFCVFTREIMPYVWFSLLAPAMLVLYNGKSGSKRLKWAFYAFYPAHLAILYLIYLIFF
ncbi:MAG: hypothetical protein IK108_02785 [Clostridia bacterium]|nr:hypothetical protein [Clostridia bacterium]